MDWATLSYNIWSHFPILFSLKLFKLMLEFEWNYNVSSLKMLRYELDPKKSHFLTSLIIVPIVGKCNKQKTK